jgi:hypothetical protein
MSVSFMTVDEAIGELGCPCLKPVGLAYVTPPLPRLGFWRVFLTGWRIRLDRADGRFSLLIVNDLAGRL